VTSGSVSTKKSKKAQQIRKTCQVHNTPKRKMTDTTVSKPAKKKRKTSNEAVGDTSINNGSAGACTCNSSCSTQNCPCKLADTDCTTKCHRSKKGKEKASWKKCKRRPKNHIQTVLKLKAGTLVKITYRRSHVADGRVVSECPNEEMRRNI
jgi:hypothetical protein